MVEISKLVSQLVDGWQEELRDKPTSFKYKVYDLVKSNLKEEHRVDGSKRVIENMLAAILEETRSLLSERLVGFIGGLGLRPKKESFVEFLGLMNGWSLSQLVTLNSHLGSFYTYLHGSSNSFWNDSLELYLETIIKKIGELHYNILSQVAAVYKIELEDSYSHFYLPPQPEKKEEDLDNQETEIKFLEN